MEARVRRGAVRRIRSSPYIGPTIAVQARKRLAGEARLDPGPPRRAQTCLDRLEHLRGHRAIKSCNPRLRHRSLLTMVLVAGALVIHPPAAR